MFRASISSTESLLWTAGVCGREPGPDIEPGPLPSLDPRLRSLNVDEIVGRDEGLGDVTCWSKAVGSLPSACSWTRYVLSPRLMFNRDNRSERLLSDRAVSPLAGATGTGEMDLSSSSLSVEFSMKETFWGAMSSAAGAGSAWWMRRGGSGGGTSCDSCSLDPCLENCLGGASGAGSSVKGGLPGEGDSWRRKGVPRAGGI